MARNFTPQIVTANDLLEGDVVYLTSDGGWARRLPGAAVAANVHEAERLLDLANAQFDRIVDPYLTEVLVAPNGRLEPRHFREIFRTRGPSNRPDHGKQAELDHVSL